MKFMKRLLACLLVITLLAPAAAQAASKIAVPTKVTAYSKMDPDSDEFMKTYAFSLSYDKSGRIKKIKVASSITDNSWSYTFTYKKSGSNYIVKATYISEDDGTDAKSYTFTSKGFLSVFPKKISCSGSYFDSKKTKLKVLVIPKKQIFSFAKNGNAEGILYLNSKNKLIGETLFVYKKGQIAQMHSFDFKKPVSLDYEGDELDKAIDKADYSTVKFSTKTAKKSMSSAVKWMNRFLLEEYMYAN